MSRRNYQRNTLAFVVLLVTTTGCAATTPQPTVTVSAPTPAASPTTAPRETPTALANIKADATTTDSASAISSTTVALLPPEPPPLGVDDEFRTDFKRHTVSYADVLSGGPPRDGIPSIDKPTFDSVDAAAATLESRSPVMVVVVGNDARAYPISVMIWHEIVNDVVGGKPLTVTYCPLCNTAIVFERVIAGKTLDFGATGRLRFSNLIMYDRQTESWWQQGSGAGIAGEYAGRRLTRAPGVIVDWAAFKAAFPNGKVLRPDGNARRYGVNPYVGYDNEADSPFLYRGPEIPGALPALARVLGVERGEHAVAVAYQQLQRERVVNTQVGGEAITVFWTPGTASPLDTAQIDAGRDVGSANAFLAMLDGEALTFKADGERIVDAQSGSTWDVLGRAIAGPRAGKRLTPVVATNHFWFSWASFAPNARLAPEP